MTGSTMKNDHDKQVCRTVLDFIVRRKNIVVYETYYPEERERQKKAVEMVAKTSSGEIFFEHTRIQAFADQIDGSTRFYKLLKEPLEKGLDGKLPPPGHYTLSADIATTRGTKWKAKHIQKVLIEWVKNNAPSLELRSPSTAPNHMVTEKPAGVPLEVTLSRWPGFDGRFWVTSHAPAELEKKRREPIRKAIEEKWPKLREARGDDGRSVFVAEICDIALGDTTVTMDILRKEMSSRDDIPDEIYMVRTDLDKWHLRVFKDGDALFRNMDDAEAYYSEPLTP